MVMQALPACSQEYLLIQTSRHPRVECQQHHKRTISQCSWCGEGMCQHCLAKRLGSQQYCTDCAKALGGAIEQKQIERMRRV